jgi:hypothetical protein
LEDPDDEDETDLLEGFDEDSDYAEDDEEEGGVDVSCLEEEDEDEEGGVEVPCLDEDDDGVGEASCAAGSAREASCAAGSSREAAAGSSREAAAGSSREASKAVGEPSKKSRKRNLDYFKNVDGFTIGKTTQPAALSPADINVLKEADARWQHMFEARYAQAQLLDCQELRYWAREAILRLMPDGLMAFFQKHTSVEIRLATAGVLTLEKWESMPAPTDAELLLPLVYGNGIARNGPLLMIQPRPHIVFLHRKRQMDHEAQCKLRKPRSPKGQPFYQFCETGNDEANDSDDLVVIASKASEVLSKSRTHIRLQFLARPSYLEH